MYGIRTRPGRCSPGTTTTGRRFRTRPMVDNRRTRRRPLRVTGSGLDLADARWAQRQPRAAGSGLATRRAQRRRQRTSRRRPRRWATGSGLALEDARWRSYEESLSAKLFRELNEAKRNKGSLARTRSCPLSPPWLYGPGRGWVSGGSGEFGGSTREGVHPSA